MKLGGFKNNEYLIRHKLKDINTVGNNKMKLVSLGLPLPTHPYSPNRTISGVAMMLGGAGLLSYWLKLKCAFTNLSAVGKAALADKVCYHTVFSSYRRQRLFLAPYLPRFV
jgi:hypothetical protein